MDLKIQSKNQCILTGVFNAFKFIVTVGMFVLILIIFLFKYIYFLFSPLFPLLVNNQVFLPTWNLYAYICMYNYRYIVVSTIFKVSTFLKH